MTKLIQHILSSCLIVLVFSVVLHAVPDVIRFQGRLTDSQGRPIIGTPQVSFEIYDSATGGTKLWGPTPFQFVNANDAGLFSTDIGPFASSAIFAGGQELFLQVTIKAGTAQADQVLSPRQRLTSVPFSFQARQAENATSAESVPDNSISRSKIQPDAVDSGRIVDQSIQPVDLSATVAVQFIPSGMIAMFAKACPDGWTRFDLLDDRVALGASSYTGSPSGSWQINGLSVGEAGEHAHTSSAHSHGAGGLTANPLTTRAGYQSVGGTWTPKDTPTISGQTADATVSIQNAGKHAHPVSSNGNWRPAYLGIVYCEKD